MPDVQTCGLCDERIDEKGRRIPMPGGMGGYDVADTTCLICAGKISVLSRDDAWRLDPYVPTGIMDWLYDHGFVIATHAESDPDSDPLELLTFDPAADRRGDNA